MIETWLTNLTESAQVAGDVLLAPGDFVWSVVIAFAPDLIDSLGGDASRQTVTLGIAAGYWLLVLAVAAWAISLLRSMGRSLVAILRALAYRFSQTLAGIRIRLRLKFRGFARWRRLLRHVEPPVVEFDDLELAVLRYGVRRGPGFAISAPELAEEFSVRPAQVQRCLDKLLQNRMLDHAIGSTEGFDNYRLTDSGTAFFEMWQRQSSTA